MLEIIITTAQHWGSGFSGESYLIALKSAILPIATLLLICRKYGLVDAFGMWS